MEPVNQRTNTGETEWDRHHEESIDLAVKTGRATREALERLHEMPFEEQFTSS